jgi:hypothetical protein
MKGISDTEFRKTIAEEDAAKAAKRAYDKAYYEQHREEDATEKEDRMRYGIIFVLLGFAGILALPFARDFIIDRVIFWIGSFSLLSTGIGLYLLIFPRKEVRNVKSKEV